jgi:hypothetical protein
MREPLEVKWTDCGDHWELQIVHQEFLRMEFHKNATGGPSCDEFCSPVNILLVSSIFPNKDGRTLYVRGVDHHRNNDIVRIPRALALPAMQAIREYNEANCWRMEGSQSVVARQSTVDPDWEQRILAKRDALLRDCFS